jgi:hypothetical protein
MNLILIKMPVAPHKQRVLPHDSDEDMKLQQWANKQAASILRDQGKAAGGVEFETMRNNLMREAVADPEKHGLGFLGGPPIPFDDEGGEEETHTMPDGTEMEGATHEEPAAAEEEAEVEGPTRRPSRQTTLGDFKSFPQAMNIAWGVLKQG